MIYENDCYEILKEPLSITHEKIQEKLRKKELTTGKKRPKRNLNRNIKFNFD